MSEPLNPQPNHSFAEMLSADPELLPEIRCTVANKSMRMNENTQKLNYEDLLSHTPEHCLRLIMSLLDRLSLNIMSSVSRRMRRFAEIERSLRPRERATIRVVQNAFGHVVYLRKGNAHKIVCVKSLAASEKSKCEEGDTEELSFIFSGKTLRKSMEKYIGKKFQSTGESTVPCRVFAILDHILALFKVGEITFTNVNINHLFITHLLQIFHRRTEVKTVWCNGQMASVRKVMKDHCNKKYNLERMTYETLSNILYFADWNDRINLRATSKKMRIAVLQTDFYPYVTEFKIRKYPHCIIKLDDCCYLRDENPENLGFLAELRKFFFKRTYVHKVSFEIKSFDKRTVFHIDRVLEGVVYNHISFYVTEPIDKRIHKFLKKFDSKKVTLSLDDSCIQRYDLLSFHRPVEIEFTGIEAIPAGGGRKFHVELLIELVKRGHSVLNMQVCIRSAETLFNLLAMIADASSAQCISFDVPNAVYVQFMTLIGLTKTETGFVKEEGALEVSVLYEISMSGKWTGDYEFLYRGATWNRVSYKRGITKVEISKHCPRRDTTLQWLPVTRIESYWDRLMAHI